jgi:hypothetical protein
VQLPTNFSYGLHFSLEMCISDLFPIQVALFSRNMQLPTSFPYGLYFSLENVQLQFISNTSCTFPQEICNCQLVSHMVALFLQICTTLIFFRYELHFFPEMCNCQLVFHIGCNFLQKCATPTYFQYELHFKPECATTN